MSHIILKNVYKYYENKIAIHNLSLEINKQEFIVIVGPSGCGKTTLLKMIAGLEEITQGELLIDGINMKNTPANKRNISMVFQNYPLFNHMTVTENILFGLKDKNQTYDLNKLSRQLSIQDLLHKKPPQLSGGEKQRVAIARSLISNPSILLLDEPLSSLDPTLKNQLSDLIKQLHKEYQMTVVYVTHDQHEALSLADRILVLKDGLFQQFASPTTLYENPENIFIGGFIGQNPMNFIEVETTEDGFIHFSNHYRIQTGYRNKKIILGIRPEHIYESEDGILCQVDKFEMIGKEKYVYTTICNTKVKIQVQRIIESDTINVSFDSNKIKYYEKKLD